MSFPVSLLPRFPASPRFSFPASLPPRFPAFPLPRFPAYPPHRPVGEVLLLPNRYSPLQLLDDVAASHEGLISMRRAGRDGHRGIADFQPADAMLDRHPNLPAGFRLGHDAGNLGLRHWRIGRVVQPQHRPPTVMIANRAEKAGDATSRRRLHRVEQ